MSTNKSLRSSSSGSAPREARKIYSFLRWLADDNSRRECNLIDSRFLFTKVDSEWNHIRAAPMCLDYLFAPVGWSFVTRIHARVEQQNPKPSWNSNNTSRKLGRQIIRSHVSHHERSAGEELQYNRERTSINFSLRQSWASPNPRETFYPPASTNPFKSISRSRFNCLRIQSSSRWRRLSRGFNMWTFCCVCCNTKAWTGAAENVFLPPVSQCGSEERNSEKTYKRTFFPILFVDYFRIRSAVRRGRKKYLKEKHEPAAGEASADTFTSPWKRMERMKRQPVPRLSMIKLCKILEKSTWRDARPRDEREDMMMTTWRAASIEVREGKWPKSSRSRLGWFRIADQSAARRIMEVSVDFSLRFSWACDEFCFQHHPHASK